MEQDPQRDEQAPKSSVHISDDEFSFADVKPELRAQLDSEMSTEDLDLDSVESLISDAGSVAAQVLNPEPMNPKMEAYVQAQSVANHAAMSPRHQVEAWLGVMVKSGASDLILRSGGKPSLRVNGRITFLPGEVPGPGPMQEILKGVLGERRMETWRETGS
ncbi:MAG: hypothetical protein KDB61_15185, partial [Planctomycetes bacterium]|nr:hypothetical protein [Planctomycetota bacterium]